MTISLQQKIELAFLDALNDKTDTLRDIVISNDFETRLEIYSTSITASHQQALYKIFKPLEKLLGIDAFQELCYRYVKYKLSTHFNFNYYGVDLHEFILKAPYAKDLPYISDFIQFCYIWQQVFLDNFVDNVNFISDYPVYPIWERCQPEFNGSQTIANWDGPFSYTIYRESGKVAILEH